jgi:2-dehydro-3-deoxygalactonokinase
MTMDWIAVDWGTSNLRAWAMDETGVRDHATSAEGMGALKPDEFEDALLRLIGPWLTDRPTRVIACGMVGARQGWQEAPYRAVPCLPVAAGHLMSVATKDPRILVQIVPGLSQSKPADVMRGEETQIAGVIALQPQFDGVICLPGTHSKWAHISAAEVVSFQTFMTGEMFALLSKQSVLRHGMQDAQFDGAAFDLGVDAGLSHPEKIMARLFGLRAEGLLSNLGKNAAFSRLSGLLIGAELAAAKPYWLGQAVRLVGAETLSGHYARALSAQGVTAQILDDTACSIAGLARAFTKETE